MAMRKKVSAENRLAYNGSASKLILAIIFIGLTLFRLDNKLLHVVRHHHDAVNKVENNDNDTDTDIHLVHTLNDNNNNSNQTSEKSASGSANTDGLTGRRQAMGYEFAHVTHTHSSSADVWPIAFDTLQKFGYDTAPSDMEFYVCLDNNTEAISNLTSQWPWLRPVIYTDELYPSKVAQCLDKIDAPYVFHMMEE